MYRTINTISTTVTPSIVQQDLELNDRQQCDDTHRTSPVQVPRRFARILACSLAFAAMLLAVACGTDEENGSDTRSEDTDSEDTDSEDTDSEDTGSEDTDSEDTGSEDTGSEDTGDTEVDTDLDAEPDTVVDTAIDATTDATDDTPDTAEDTTEDATDAGPDTTNNCPDGFWGPDCEQLCDCDEDDGLFCNGEVFCDEFEGCVTIAAPEVDDGVECTIDSCNEDTDRVDHEPDDGVCNFGGDCTYGLCTATGCERIPLENGIECATCVFGYCFCDDGACENFAGRQVHSIAAGSDALCLTLADGTLVCAPGVEAPPVLASQEGGFVHIAGSGFFCGLERSSTLRCDTTAAGAPSVVPHEGDFVTGFDVSAAGVCALNDRGEIACEATPALNDGVPGDELGLLSAVSLGARHACALSAEGFMTCWGDDVDGSTSPPDGTFVEMVSGDDFSCALREGGTTACWGTNSDGQTTHTPSTEGGYRQLAAGPDYACGLEPSGFVQCWGNIEEPYTAPTQSDEGGYVGITVNYHYGCGLEPSGSVRCWGTNAGFIDGALLRTSPAEVTNVAGIHATVCALTQAGDIVCGGSAQHRGLQPPTSTEGGFVDLAANSGGGCAMEPSGTLRCFGIDVAHLPEEFVPGSAFASVDVGLNQTCGMTAAGALTCIGDTAGLTSEQGGFTQFSVGGSHSCALEPDGTIRCWGRTDEGQGAPVPASLEGGYVGVSLTVITSCGLEPSGAVQCWGEDEPGVQVPDAAVGPYSQLELHRQIGCGLDSAGTATCWGDNELGIHDAPAAVVGSYVDLSVALASACALESSGNVNCWGHVAHRFLDAPVSLAPY